MQPRVDNRMFIVAVALEARRPEDIDAFIEALEMTGMFQNVLATETQANEDGLLEAIIEGQYQPRARASEPAAGSTAR
jgi:hypothetical protein